MPYSVHLVRILTRVESFRTDSSAPPLSADNGSELGRFRTAGNLRIRWETMNWPRVRERNSKTRLDQARKSIDNGEMRVNQEIRRQCDSELK